MGAEAYLCEGGGGKSEEPLRGALAQGAVETCKDNTL